MSWIKKGLVFSCQDNGSWRHSHAYMPTALVLDDRVRVYLAFRDAQAIGRVGFVDLDLDNPLQVIGISENPVLQTGPAGAFDDAGATPFSLVRDDDSLRLYYAGWHRSVSVRYHIFTGLAISCDNGLTFQRHGNVPVLDRTEHAWLVRSGISIMKTGDIWKCWCAASDGVVNLEGKSIPVYDWGYLESADGIHWPREHRKVLSADVDKGILGYGRTSVLHEHGIYKAWVPVRTAHGYTSMAYIHSADGIHWSDFDYHNGLMPSEDGFDSKEVSFPSVFDIGERRYMVYNGNDFGKTGFGLALWQD